MNADTAHSTLHAVSISQTDDATDEIAWNLIVGPGPIQGGQTAAASRSVFGGAEVTRCTIGVLVLTIDTYDCDSPSDGFGTRRFDPRERDDRTKTVTSALNQWHNVPLAQMSSQPNICASMRDKCVQQVKEFNTMPMYGPSTALGNKYSMQHNGTTLDISRYHFYAS